MTLGYTAVDRALSRTARVATTKHLCGGPSGTRGVLAEFGTVISPKVDIRVSDSTSQLRYLVLPLRPAGAEGWTQEQLAALVTRDAMIGLSTINAQDRKINNDTI